MTRDALSHEQAVELLPWLANGTLEGEELERVERHVRECLPCRAELNEQRALKTLMQRHGGSPAPAEQGFQGLCRRIDTGASNASSPRRLLASRGMFAAAAGLAAVGIGAVLGLSTYAGRDAAVLDAARYGTLTDSPAAGARIDVIFTEDITERQMRALLDELDATIVAGPSRLGRYMLQLSSADATDADVEALVRRLMGDARVRFAGRSFASGDGAEPRQ